MRGKSLLQTVFMLALISVRPACMAGCFELIQRKPVLDPVTGSQIVETCVIVQSRYDLLVSGDIRRIPLIAIRFKGRHATVIDRAQEIKERLEHAVDLLSRGGTLEVKDTPEGSALYVNGPWAHPFRPNVADQETESFRILTIYPEDAALFAGAGRDANRIASYLGALFEAHLALFFDIALDASRYEGLSISSSREGKIFQHEVMPRVKESLWSRHIPEVRPPSDDKKLYQEFHKTLKDVLAGMEEGQRERILLLPFVVPVDWKPQ